MRKISSFSYGVMVGAIVTASLISFVDAGELKKKDTPWKFNACPLGEPPIPSVVESGATVTMHHYGAGETIRWAADFFVNPERARNREVLYVYAAADVVDNFGLVASQASKTPVNLATFNAETPKSLGYKTPSHVVWQDSIAARVGTISVTEDAWAQGRAKSAFGNMISSCAETPGSPAFVAISHPLPKNFEVLGRFIAERTAWEPAQQKK